jgi:hypothetical protein
MASLDEAPGFEKAQTFRLFRREKAYVEADAVARALPKAIANALESALANGVAGWEIMEKGAKEAQATMTPLDNAWVSQIRQGMRLEEGQQLGRSTTTSRSSGSSSSSTGSAIAWASAGPSIPSESTAS